MVIKIDLEKAYDHMNQRLVKDTLDDIEWPGNFF